MKRVYIILAILLSIQTGYAQIKEMHPTQTERLDLSAKGEKAFEAKAKAIQKIYEKLEKKGGSEALTKKERELLDSYDDTIDSYWSIIGSGCSWYCGGGTKSVTASSHLKAQGSINYLPDNAHDLNYKNAWAEGVPGYGIGEYLLYTFDATAPRINQIIVVNGYVKSKTAWENNSRVKKLKVYINNKPYAILNLKDIRGSQTFDVEPIGNTPRENEEEMQKKGDWTMKFEILEVYKGAKYDDVIISEIYFDGLDVHCLAKGTPVLMADMSEKNIEDLEIGDLVAYIDGKEFKTARIEKLAKATHHGLVTYRFESGRSITTTQDHPFRIETKGWSSLSPEKSARYRGFEKVRKVEIGDEFATASGRDRLIAIEHLNETQETYTISKMNNGDHFIANGLIVGIEELNE
ncbi:hypothetical protein [Porphyromonas sp.]|uniref:NADase-type glycan-binding domain-containing protein n=1 Tax=Porphyromonas sp. TaxID=1924944 RepID=UPI0026DAFB2E|nr:hypothetical protein [Porphyromonas sp.]MDO4695509.1 hypothetical protein [Porphyromonas sp.]MDO4770250.1 hypothetical protein [Porphyromonas sp.]